MRKFEFSADKYPKYKNCINLRYRGDKTQSKFRNDSKVTKFIYIIVALTSLKMVIFS